MKRTILALLTCVAATTLSAQYSPYLNGEYTWRVTYPQSNENTQGASQGKSVYEITLEGDTTVNHTKYKKMYKRALMVDGVAQENAPKQLHMVLCDVAGIIYYLRNQGDTQGVVLYDFLLQPETSHMMHLNAGLYGSERIFEPDELRTISFCKSRETVNICGHDYAAMNMLYIDPRDGEVYGSCQWIEGLGDSQGIFFQSASGLGYPAYEMFDKDGNLVFRSYTPEQLVDGVLAPAVVESVVTSRPFDEKRFRLDGTPATADEEGVYVQNGRVYLNVK